MYRTAIKSALEYVRPFLIGRLFYENKYITNDISTMMVLNKNGDILTTAKTADIFISCSEYNETYPSILKEIKDSKPKNIKKIEEKYGITKDTIVGMHNILIDIADNPGKLTVIKHPYLDMAIISIQNKEELLVENFPKFARKKLEPGDSICTLGFAFPEYKAFKYDEENFKITSDFKLMNFPIFPTDGIMARNIADKNDNISMLEISNLIVPGMEGGPILSKDGLVYGMIVGFSVIKDVGGLIRLGMGINNIEIMKFLDDNNIEYEVSNE